VPLVDSRQGKHSELILTAAGLHQHAGKLVAYYGQYEYMVKAIQDGIKNGRGHQDTRLYAMTTNQRRAVAGAAGHGHSIIPNHGPQPLRSGRLVISGNIAFPYTDDASGLSGWKMTGILS